VLVDRVLDRLGCGVGSVEVSLEVRSERQHSVAQARQPPIQAHAVAGEAP
jgi:hypothetical protein